MAKIVRYNGNLKAFASEQLTNERTLFGSTTIANDLTSQITAQFLRGWGIVGPSDQPSLQDFNAALYTNGQLLAYLHQVGVPEYNAAQEYHQYSICNSLGILYSSLANTNVGNTPAASPAQWRELYAQSSESVRGTMQLATNAQALAGTNDTAAMTPLKVKNAIAGSAASETVAGIAEIATQAETGAGTDDARFVTPLKLKNAYGLGSSATSTNLDDVGTGFFYVTGGPTGAPVSGAFYGQTRGGAASTSKTQTGIEVATGFTYTRVYSGSAWLPWRAAIDTGNIGNYQLGGSTQAWAVMSRAPNTAYSNDTGKPIFIAATLVNAISGTGYFQVNGIRIVNLGTSASAASSTSVFVVVPAGATYGAVGTQSVTTWSELR